MAITEYYASTAGSGAHDGSSSANEWTHSEAITANNALGAGGAAARRINVRGNATARGASDTISVGGTTTSPSTWRAYVAAPGDLDYATYDAYGNLDTTNLPDIGYNSTFKLTVSGADTILANFDITGSRSGEIVSFSGANIILQNSRVTNSSTNAAAVAMLFAGGQTKLINCGFSTAASGGTAAVDAAGIGTLYGCRVTAPGCTGVRISAANALVKVVNSAIYNCVDGIAVTHASGSILSYHNTIYGCVDGIDIISTSTSLSHEVYGCSITDNSGYGINCNGGTSGGLISWGGNRLRDNALGDTSGYADWFTASGFRNITTDTGGAATDYVDAATNKDFRLISTAAGYRQGFAYNSNIGACGDNVTAGSSGIKSARGINGGLT